LRDREFEIEGRRRLHAPHLVEAAPDGKRRRVSS